MCLNCGCGNPDERHDDAANITRDDLQKAAEANGQSLEEAARNVKQALNDLVPSDAQGAYLAR